MNGNEKPPEPEPSIENNSLSEKPPEIETVTAASLVTQDIPVPSRVQATQAESVPPESLLNESAKTLPAKKGKGYRKLEDYARLDWTGTNVEIANEAGITRQRAQQLRNELKTKGYIDADGNPLKKIPSQQSLEGQADFSDIVTPETLNPPVVIPAKSADDYQLMADATFDMVAGGMAMIIGPEWQPRDMQGPDGKTFNERVVVIEPLKKYYAAKQVEDLPPGIVLAFACLVYAAPRFKEPNTKEKTRLGWQWLKVKVGGIFKRFRKQRPTNITVLDNETKPEKKNEN